METKMKLLALSAILILGTCNLQAQAGFGIQGGINLQNINGKDGSGEKLTNSLITGFHAGVNINIPVATDFYFQPGLLFAVKGSKNDFFSPPTKASGDYATTTRISYLELPLNLLYRPLVGKGHILLGFGPYIAYGIGGKENSDFGSLSYERKVKFKNSVSDMTDLIKNAYYRPFDAGANIFFGYELSNGIFFQLDAQLGMLKINPEYSWINDDKRSYKNTGFGFSLGYRF
jgi:hypothetical protein